MKGIIKKPFVSFACLPPASHKAQDETPASDDLVTNRQVDKIAASSFATFSPPRNDEAGKRSTEESHPWRERRGFGREMGETMEREGLFTNKVASGTSKMSETTSPISVKLCRKSLAHKGNQLQMVNSNRTKLDYSNNGEYNDGLLQRG